MSVTVFERGVATFTRTANVHEHANHFFDAGIQLIHKSIRRPEQTEEKRERREQNQEHRKQRRIYFPIGSVQQQGEPTVAMAGKRRKARGRESTPTVARVAASGRSGRDSPGRSRRGGEGQPQRQHTATAAAAATATTPGEPAPTVRIWRRRKTQQAQGVEGEARGHKTRSTSAVAQAAARGGRSRRSSRRHGCKDMA